MWCGCGGSGGVVVVLVVVWCGCGGSEGVVWLWW